MRASRRTPPRASETPGHDELRGDRAKVRSRVAREDGGRLLVNVRVVPRAAREQVELDGQGLRVRLTAPPVEGAANVALITLLAGRLGVPKRSLTLVRGATAREKQIAVVGLSVADFWARLGM